MRKVVTLAVLGAFLSVAAIPSVSAGIECDPESVQMSMSNGADGFLQGSATWQAGAVAHWCGASVPTPAALTSADTGTITEAPFRIENTGDTQCRKVDFGDGGWGYKIVMAAEINSGSYQGDIPTQHFVSDVSFDIPTTTSEDYVAQNSGWEIKAECTATYQIDYERARKGQETWVEEQLKKGSPWPSTISLAYVRQADGSHLVELSGSGEADLNIDFASGSLLNGICVAGGHAWIFDGVWTVETIGGGTHDPAVMGNIVGHGESTLDKTDLTCL